MSNNNDILEINENNEIILPSSTGHFLRETIFTMLRYMKEGSANEDGVWKQNLMFLFTKVKELDGKERISGAAVSLNDSIKNEDIFVMDDGLLRLSMERKVPEKLGKTLFCPVFRLADPEKVISDILERIERLSDDFELANDVVFLITRIKDAEGYRYSCGAYSLEALYEGDRFSMDGGTVFLTVKREKQ